MFCLCRTGLLIKGGDATGVLLQKHLIDLGNISNHFFGAETWINVPSTIRSEPLSECLIFEEASYAVSEANGIKRLNEITGLVIDHNLASTVDVERNTRFAHCKRLRQHACQAFA